MSEHIKTSDDLRLELVLERYPKNHKLVSVPWLKEQIENRMKPILDTSEADELCVDLYWMLSLLEER